MCNHIRSCLQKKKKKKVLINTHNFQLVLATKQLAQPNHILTYKTSSVKVLPFAPKRLPRPNQVFQNHIETDLRTHCSIMLNHSEWPVLLASKSQCWAKCDMPQSATATWAPRAPGGREAGPCTDILRSRDSKENGKKGALPSLIFEKRLSAIFQKYIQFVMNILPFLFCFVLLCVLRIVIYYSYVTGQLSEYL